MATLNAPAPIKPNSYCKIGDNLWFEFARIEPFNWFQKLFIKFCFGLEVGELK
jgi:hypothetical protein